MAPRIYEKNGVRIADAKEITCEECGKGDLRTIEANHLTGSKCTGDVSNREAYEKRYPTEPVVTRDFYESIGGTVPEDD
jgi:hypothetical protein